jgi:hypothetical protein
MKCSMPQMQCTGIPTNRLPLVSAVHHIMETVREQVACCNLGYRLRYIENYALCIMHRGPPNWCTPAGGGSSTNTHMSTPLELVRHELLACNDTLPGEEVQRLRRSGSLNSHEHPLGARRLLLRAQGDAQAPELALRRQLEPAQWQLWHGESSS